MWHFQQRENSYRHVTRINRIGTRATSDTPQNGKIYDRRILNLGMKPKRSKAWDMKWYWLRDKELIDKLRVYWDKGKNNDPDYFTKYHSPIHHHQVRPQYIHTSNLVRKLPQIIRLCKGVLNRVPGTQSRVNYLKEIREKPQSMTDKCRTVRRLKTWSSPRYPVRSHSLVCIENHLFIVGIRPILNKELEFFSWSDRSDRT